ncbi:MAG: N-acyl homoserine lactonase family protein [Candidatus Limnocylindria bacterium]
MVVRSTVTRMHVGGFLAPESYGPNERLVVNAWLVRHPEATILVDTGIADDIPEADVEALRFVRTPILETLARLGVRADAIDLVINCHLHADHAGGNHRFSDARILVQPAELAAAREPDYSVPSALNLDGGRYEARDGEHEPLPGIRIVPTPGHSPGHQSVVVETDAERLLLAGQCYRDASSFGRAVTALELERAGYPHAAQTPDWLPRLLDLGADRVAFGHDRAVWVPD